MFQQLTITPKKAGLYNLPLEAPPDDLSDIDELNGEKYMYLKTPRKAATIAEIIARSMMNEGHIMTSTTVDKIDWHKRHVKVFATSAGACYRFRAKRVLVTTSIGVMDKRGDCKYTSEAERRGNCDEKTTDLVMYNPRLPARKMNAVRELYIDDDRRPTSMGEYREIRIQFGTKFWNDVEEYIIINNKVGERGRCTAIQNLEAPNFYPGLNALVCTLTTEVFDKLGGPTKVLGSTSYKSEDEVVNQLLQNSLGNVYNYDFFPGGYPRCTSTSPFAAFPNPNPPQNLDECVYSYFTGENKNWYGAYSSWKPSSHKNAGRHMDRLFDRVFAPLQPSKARTKKHVLWFTGAAYCDAHSEFTHGAYWSGRLAMNEILDDWGYNLDPSLKNTPEYGFCFPE